MDAPLAALRQALGLPRVGRGERSGGSDAEGPAAVAVPLQQQIEYTEKGKD